MKAKYSCPHCGGPMNVEVTEVSVKITRESTSRKLDPAMSLVVYQSTNRAGRHDATGAFKPEALEYKRLHSVSPKLMLPIPHGLDAVNKARKVLGALRGIGDGQLDAFVYFGHGTTKSFPSMGFGLGFSGDRDVRQLAAEIARVGGGNIFVCLYACLTGKGFGVADWLGDELRDRLDEPGARVFAHLGAGHTTKFPFAEYSGEGAGDLGVPVIGSKDPLWRKWVNKLQNDQAFRLSIPFMTKQEIREALA